MWFRISSGPSTGKNHRARTVLDDHENSLLGELAFGSRLVVDVDAHQDSERLWERKQSSRPTRNRSPNVAGCLITGDIAAPARC